MEVRPTALMTAAQKIARSKKLQKKSEVQKSEKPKVRDLRDRDHGISKGEKDGPDGFDRFL